MSNSLSDVQIDLDRERSKMNLKELSASLTLFLLFLPIFTDADQMCYVCQFATSLPVECATDPKAWKGGDPFVRCSQDCTIDAIFDAETGIPTFVNRGCHKAHRENGCVLTGKSHSCFFSCKGKNYCNGQYLARSPMQDSDGASSLTPRSPVGFLLTALSLSTFILVWLAVGN
ncbi:hypothetical protein RRG08_025909 [Elysia crispata]|uniref:Uncharacterized protein n=1 Tax=Elysia crispata TaxID=231223 RepID=A0AAE1AH83_9GAST|nr:hypothetical protein RRG08_025909 [Elysia crispata]